MKKFEDISQALLEKNIKPSYNRTRIMDYLLSKKSHPTAEEIYSVLVKEIPTLSKTTVYNTLNILAAKNLVKIITIEDNEARFDADTSEHGHFKCGRCGKIFDFVINEKGITTAGLDGFLILEKDFYYRGTCPMCLKTKL